MRKKGSSSKRKKGSSSKMKNNDSYFRPEPSPSQSQDKVHLPSIGHLSLEEKQGLSSTEEVRLQHKRKREEYYNRARLHLYMSDPRDEDECLWCPRQFANTLYTIEHMLHCHASEIKAASKFQRRLNQREKSSQPSKIEPGSVECLWCPERFDSYKIARKHILLNHGTWDEGCEPSGPDDPIYEDYDDPANPTRPCYSDVLPTNWFASCYDKLREKEGLDDGQSFFDDRISRYDLPGEFNVDEYGFDEEYAQKNDKVAKKEVVASDKDAQKDDATPGEICRTSTALEDFNAELEMMWKQFLKCPVDADFLKRQNKGISDSEDEVSDTEDESSSDSEDKITASRRFLDPPSWLLNQMNTCSEKRADQASKQITTRVK